MTDHMGNGWPEASRASEVRFLADRPTATPPAVTHSETDRAHVAAHECGHALLCLIHQIPFDVISIRPGAGFRGVTLLGTPTPDASREAREHRIMVTLAGGLAADVPPLAGHPPVRRVERVAESAVADLSVGVREALFAAEQDNDCWSDGRAAWHAIRSLNDGDESLIPEHWAYLSARADSALGIHRTQLQHLAAALLARTVLSYDTALAIFGSTRRCVCHGYTPPTEEVVNIFRSIGCFDHTEGVPI